MTDERIHDLDAALAALAAAAPPSVAERAAAAPPPAAPPVAERAQRDEAPPAPRSLSERERDEAPSPSTLPLGADPDLLDQLAEVAALGGSDLHLSADAPPMIRVHGGLEPQGEAWSGARVARALRSLLTPERRDAFLAARELDWSFQLTPEVRFRANYYLQRGTIGAAFRIIPVDIRPLETLGLPSSVSRFASLVRGLVLVTGPTGSGKSTTLASLIDLVNSSRAGHIMTVEDPIEFVHRNKRALINQREVGEDTHSFAAALKHVLRQDPDVILVGELRDLETIEVALTAAETGHLVFATLHTQSAPQTIDRVIGVFPPHQQEQIRAQLAGTLQGVVCQTLVRTADGAGRVLAAEVMVSTPAVANLIREGKVHQLPTAIQAGGELGMQTLDQHLARLVLAGTITRATALEQVQDREVFERLAADARVGSPTDAGGFGTAIPGAR